MQEALSVHNSFVYILKYNCRLHTYKYVKYLQYVNINKNTGNRVPRCTMHSMMINIWLSDFESRDHAILHSIALNSTMRKFYTSTNTTYLNKNNWRNENKIQRYLKYLSKDTHSILYLSFPLFFLAINKNIFNAFFIIDWIIFSKSY